MKFYFITALFIMGISLVINDMCKDVYEKDWRWRWLGTGLLLASVLLFCIW